MSIHPPPAPPVTQTRSTAQQRAFSKASPLKQAVLALYRTGYERVARPVIFRSTAGAAHTRSLGLLSRLDNGAGAALLGGVRTLTMPGNAVTAGGVALPSPLILAAGFVKGEGFEDEAQAVAKAEQHNIIPGWRAMPALAGAVEFGSFTRWPRLGNPGVVMWRETATQSTQNRVGLRNSGIKAVAAFLGARRNTLPPVWGINLAPSPGVDDDTILESELLESLDLLLDAGIAPQWFTLNLSCPNTEDDPDARQTAQQAQTLTSALVRRLERAGIPLWVKLGPTLAEAQYRVLLEVCAGNGVRAIVASNTLGRPTPDQPTFTAGVGGGIVRPYALAAVRLLAEERDRRNTALDIIGCGGVLDGESARAFLDAGAAALQYWSALVYRGPLAAAVIEAEIAQESSRV